MSAIIPRMPPLIVDDRSISDVFAGVLGTQHDPPFAVIVATAVVALIAVSVHGLWTGTRGVVTIAHEGGHALIALLTGRRVRGVRLHSDTSGVTFWRGRPTGFGAVLSVAAGYPAPAVLGLLAAAFLAFGRVTALLWFALVMLLLMLLLIRNLYGVVSVVLTGGIIFAVSWFTVTVVQGVFAYALTWFMLIAAVRPVIELSHGRRRRRLTDSDADQLARLTGTGPLLWVVIFFVVAVACLLIGGRWLLF